ncbi:MAG: four helix bundle protein [Bacteroidota bacterium]
MRDFRTLDIWKDGMSKVVSTYKIVSTFPMDERFGLRSQMSRSAVSIPSNIAEGCSRHSEIEFKRFLEIAIGSAFELETRHG